LFAVGVCPGGSDMVLAPIAGTISRKIENEVEIVVRCERVVCFIDSPDKASAEAPMCDGGSAPENPGDCKLGAWQQSCVSHGAPEKSAPKWKTISLRVSEIDGPETLCLEPGTFRTQLSGYPRRPLRRGLQTQEVSHHDTRYRTTGRPGRHRTDVARARGARLENPRNFLGDSPTGRTLELRQRQLRDEGMSGVNQHAYIRLIHRRFKLLVP